MSCWASLLASFTAGGGEGGADGSWRQVLVGNALEGQVEELVVGTVTTEIVVDVVGCMVVVDVVGCTVVVEVDKTKVV
jgi:molybdopterin-binding protein